MCYNACHTMGKAPLCARCRGSVEDGKPTGLVRALGRWTLTALVINSIVGSGIFGLPSVVAGYVGRWSPLAYLVAAAGIGIIMACFAEVASQFGQAGGPYLYAREAFGRFAGLEVAWLLWLVRLTAAAAAGNLFTSYLAEFWPGVEQPVPRLAVLTVLVGFLAVVNYRGVKSGALVSNIFTVAKLLPLVAFAVAGGIFLLQTHASAPGSSVPDAPVTARNWSEAVLVLIFAYGGFEGAVVPMAEAKDPLRDAPFALYTALATATVLFFVIQFVVVGLLPSAAATDRPLALAARLFWGRAGAALISVGALISLYGYLSAQMLHTPRITFALGESGDFPSFFSSIHRRFLTPHLSIIVFSGIVWGLAAAGNFRWNVLISSVSRLFIYGMVCASLPVLRRKRPNAPAYRLSAGPYFAAAGILFMLGLVWRLSAREWAVVLVTMAIAFANWLWSRRPQREIL
jgi:APA family basic amino acid/polyamine antiporter